MEHQRADDAELVAKSQAGNREAFGLLYDRHARMVRAVVLAVSGDWDAVDDLTQESFLRAYRKLATLRDPASFGSWISGIARRVARERRRSLQRDPLVLCDPRAKEIELHAATPLESGFREQFDLILLSLAELPERERLAIHAFFLEQQEARDASELLGISRSGFYALVQRAIARLAARIRSHETAVRKE
jgi:RNA polymerase sigma-70 factor (ECF subfamily)